MGLGNFLMNYGKVKAEGVTNSIMTALVNADLEGASEADLLTYEQNLDKLVKAVSEQASIAEKERSEAIEIVALYNQKLAAIEFLQADLVNTSDADTVSQLNAVIEEEVAALESMLPEIEREKSEAAEAEADLADMKELAKASAETLKGARKALENARKDLERAKRTTEKEEMRLKRQQELKGLTTNVGKLSTALDIMKKQADEEKVKADSIKLKGQLLGVGDDKKSNLMQAAMEKAAGKAPASTQSISDRIAALKNK